METAAAGGLIFARQLDGAGGGRALDWDEVRAAEPGRGVLWLHLERTAPEARRWLEDEAGLDPLACEALLAAETRPRSLVVGDGLLVILRGVNLNPGADPEDMVSLRLFLERERILSCRHRPILGAKDLEKALDAGRGPSHTGDFLVDLCDALVARMEPVIDALDDAISELEGETIAGKTEGVRPRLGALRREAIGLRRHIAPMRDAIGRIATDRVSWLGDLDRARLREVGDRITRYVEDLDAARERAAVVQEELASRMSEQMNRTMYLLSLVAAIFLPLGLVTGLLGVNVGGIPGAGSPSAFLELCAGLGVVALVQLWLFRKLGWF